MLLRMALTRIAIHSLSVITWRSTIQTLFVLQRCKTRIPPHLPAQSVTLFTPVSLTSFELCSSRRRGGGGEGGGAASAASCEGWFETPSVAEALVGTRSLISMEGGQESFVLSDQALESLRQAAASVSELSAAVASINQSIERCGTQRFCL